MDVGNYPQVLIIWKDLVFKAVSVQPIKLVPTDIGGSN